MERSPAGEDRLRGDADRAPAGEERTDPGDDLVVPGCLVGRDDDGAIADVEVGKARGDDAVVLAEDATGGGDPDDLELAPRRVGAGGELARDRVEGVAG